MFCISTSTFPLLPYPPEKGCLLLITVLTKSSVEESVKSDVEWFRANPLIREELKQGCQGFVLDSQTGKVRRVDV